MFRSVQIKNIRLAVFLPVCAVILVAVCLFILRAGAPDTVEIGGESYSLRAEDETDIEAFLAVCGYDQPQLLSTHEIRVPLHWNGIYERYQALQKEQGFDLVPYKGKPATERIYKAGGRYLTVLTGEGRIIAAHSCDADGGNMKGLL